MESELNTEFGKMISAARCKRELTQENISEVLDISSRNLRNIEHGDVECNWILFLKLCVYYDIDINEFAKTYVSEALDNRMKYLSDDNFNSNF